MPRPLPPDVPPPHIIDRKQRERGERDIRPQLPAPGSDHEKWRKRQEPPPESDRGVVIIDYSVKK